MTTLLHRPSTPPGSPGEAGLPLEPGDHLDRATFHARYERMPPGVKAELVRGIVYMPSPVKRDHSRPTAQVVAWLVAYAAATPGTEVHDNATVLLDDGSELQPDACLLIRPGGQTGEEAGYISGAPELVVEIASSSASYDLHSKREAYEAAGVREYLVVLVREPRVLWLSRREGRFLEVPAGKGGLLKSEIFPGLWLDPDALLRVDSAALLKSLRRGLAAKAHRLFVEELAARADAGNDKPRA